MSFRLLDTSSLQMQTWDEGNIPKYVILSHTWEHGNEVDFQEMVELVKDPQHPRRQTSGFQKIQAACQKARRHGYQYAWIDTCCINKQNLSELSEAINSMFRWYQNAEICFVFLADLEASDAEVSSLRGCRWFTRGWCMQELVAPTNITNIDEVVLMNPKNLKLVCVAAKMSWAAERQTTRTEDMAYCLLGIFGVYMPLLYGEGKNAFLRLQEEIMKQSHDPSIFAQTPESFPNPSSSSLPVRDLLATSPSDFKDYRYIMQLAVTANYPHADASPLLFSMTNNGVHFPAAQLYTTPGSGCFALRLVHSLPFKHDGPLWIHLQKVGPCMFVRVTPTQEVHDPGHTQRYEVLAMRCEPQDVFVIPKLTPLSRSLLDQALKVFVRFRIKGRNVQDLAHVFEPVQHKAAWDESDLKFETSASQARSRFTGTVKVDLDVAAGRRVYISTLGRRQPRDSTGIFKYEASNKPKGNDVAFLGFLRIAEQNFGLTLDSQKRYLPGRLLDPFLSTEREVQVGIYSITAKIRCEAVGRYEIEMALKSSESHKG